MLYVRKDLIDELLMAITEDQLDEEDVEFSRGDMEVLEEINPYCNPPPGPIHLKDYEFATPTTGSQLMRLSTRET
jgi:hypothetical protein